jgi:syntaxin 8
VIALSLPPSASSQNLIVRNLSQLKAELERLADEVDLETGGLRVGNGWGGRTAVTKAGRDADRQMMRRLWTSYDRLIGMLEEDESGRERAKALKREVGK